MERRTALVASIATGLSLAAGVGALAAAGGAPILGMSTGRGADSAHATVPLVVHHVQTIEDDIVVSTRSTELPRAVARRAAIALDAASNLPVTSIDGIPVTIGATATNVIAPATPASTAPAESTTPLPTTTPIPPMPAGCQQPQLEDNGVWNCDD